MLKRIWVVAGMSLFLAGCGASPNDSGTPMGPATDAPGSLYKSFDSGKTFAPKVTVSDKLRITSADILSWVIVPQDPQTMYIGTMDDGMFRSKDGAEHWEKMDFPPEMIYGIVIDLSDPRRIFATGVYGGVGKIYRTEDAGENWKEVYVEPGPGTIISSLAMHPLNSRILYAATDKGGVMKSTDGGAQWKNIYEADGPVTRILLGTKIPESVSLLVFQSEVLSSLDGGVTWLEKAVQSDEEVTTLSSPVSLNFDPNTPSILYAGTSTDGLFRSPDFGSSWYSLSILESAKRYPIRAVAVSQDNPNEIVLSSGSVFYRSTDGGLSWSVTELGTDRGVSIILYEPGNSAILYFGLRKFK
ncbi:MAG: hypothetical protein KA054_00140 [Candidatus Moranbacteria bacterium]|nr:hypothetical protein [Candidatus Moranbacteria bacterium]